MAAGGMSFSVDMTQLSRDLKDMDRKFAASLRKNIRAAVAESGTLILDSVRRSASWSTRIPNATKLSFAFSTKNAGAVIRVSKKDAPHGRPYEMGSNGAPNGVIVHPLFGNKNKIVVQRTRPFFFSAIDKNNPALTAKIVAAVDRVVAESGYKGS
jgi:hypothetical protein